MTSRAGWLLLSIALGIPCLPGCLPFQCCRNHVESVQKTGVPNPDNACVKCTGASGEAVGELSAYPTVTGGPGLPADEQAKPVLPGVQPETRGTVEYENPTPALPSPVAERKPEPIKLAPLVEALQDILDDRHQDALRVLQAYDRETQEFYLRALPALTILAQASR